MMPKVDDSLIGFKIEYAFTYLDDDGSTYTYDYDGWCDGVVEKIIIEKQEWF